MQLIQGEVYHVFNRGNNKQEIFFRRENYHYFLRGVHKYLSPHCDILAWCLMPNHFHFLIHANSNSIQPILDGSFKRQQFSQGIKQLLSSYTKAINKQEGRTGSLFQQKTRAVWTSDPDNNYSSTALHYIHQNPLKSRLVEKMEDWEFSSFQEYTGKSSQKICNRSLCVKLLDLNLNTFYDDSYKVQIIDVFGFS